MCAVCGESLLSPWLERQNENQVCGLCRRARPVYARAVAYGSYADNVRGLLHLLKYEQVLPAAPVLGGMLRAAVERLGPLTGEPRILVVPVPLYKAKLRQRGFNQSELITRNALKDKQFAARFELDATVLQRVRETRSQIGLTRHQRRENLRGAFAVQDVGKVRNREVVLVDDVFTTGTTASECARILLRAGASKVYVATVARTMKLAAQKIELKSDAAGYLAMAAAS